MDPVELEKLCTLAREVAGRAYAPASNFHVGSALLGTDGRVFLGCNVENASFGLTVCAERNAVARAVADGCRAFELVVVYTPMQTPGTPCGACRQVLAEFSPAMRVVLIGDGDERVDTTLDRLLPDAFRFEVPE